MNILATSGGFRPDRRYGWTVGPVLRYALSLSGATRPRVCLMNTATGDDTRSYAYAYAAFAREVPEAQLSHLALFPMPSVVDPAAHLLEQDLVWVGGGSVANLAAVWRTHGLDEAFRAAWQQGVVLGGVSAGSLCWHVGGTTDSFGTDLRLFTDGIGLLPYSNTPHYDSEEQRRPLYQSLVASGQLPAGWATDDGVGLHFSGTELVDVITDRPDAFAWRVQPGDEPGSVLETRLTPRILDSQPG